MAFAVPLDDFPPENDSRKLRGGKARGSTAQDMEIKRPEQHSTTKGATHTTHDCEEEKKRHPTKRNCESKKRRGCDMIARTEQQPRITGSGGGHH